MSLLNVAIYDAIVAASDSKYFYARKRPIATSPNLDTAVETPASPSYPSEHAVVAGAASEILAYIYPRRRLDLPGQGPGRTPTLASRPESSFRATARPGSNSGRP
jgi:membrane-associated phospholipid phosphatase